MTKPLKVFLYIVGLLFIVLCSYWFLYLNPPIFILQMSLPESAKVVTESENLDDANAKYNEQIQSEYQDVTDATELTRSLTEQGYKVLVVAEQEKEEDKPYCAITWWTVEVSEDGLYRKTSDMDSHSQICSKAAEMQSRYVEGTSLENLVSQLIADDFEVRMSANLKRNKFPCGLTWSVRWIEDEAQQVSNVTGDFRYNCI